MQLTVIKEESDSRVAMIPAAAKKYIELGLEVVVQKGAGEAAGFTDEEYQSAGAKIAKDLESAVKAADIITKVRAPSKKEISKFAPQAILITNLADADTDALAILKERRIMTFALEKMPRISRAQSMDILSSQSNIAGYRAVVDAFYEYNKVVPMMMTAAGTIPAAKVLVLGVGVAGLQAIATAKRMGAIVFASDIRPETKEQVESLGAKFTPSEDVAKQLTLSDIVITSAIVAGKKAPVLISDSDIEAMKAGAVIVDMAAASGGNVQGTKAGDTALIHGVKVLGKADLAGELAPDASMLLSKNYLNFITPMIKGGKLGIDFNDDIYKVTCVYR